MLEKIISGGQTGADIAGLLVAKRFGLATGGTMPQGFITQAGPQPAYAEKFGMIEHKSPKYPARTFANVSDSDGTIRLAFDHNSSGEKLTLKAIQTLKKPYIDVDLAKTRPPQEVADWINKYSIKILNVAGNSERTYSGVTGEAIDYLSSVLEKLGLKQVA